MRLVTVRRSTPSADGGRGDVPLRGEVGAQGRPRRSAAVRCRFERFKVELVQRGGDEIVAEDRGQQDDVGVVQDRLAAALGDRQRRLGLTVAESPPRQSLAGLADRSRSTRSSGISPSARSACRGLERTACRRASRPRSAPPRGRPRAGGGRAWRPAARIASGAPSPLAIRARWWRIEVIAELGVVDLLAGEQALDALAASLRAAARPALGLAHVLLALGFEQAVEERSPAGAASGAGRRSRTSARSASSTRKSPSSASPADVATQHGVQRYAGASGKASLRQEGRWDAGGAALAELDRDEGVVEGRGEGTVEAMQVTGVCHLAGIGDRVNAGGDGRFELGQTCAKSGRDRRGGLLERRDGRRSSTGPPSGVARAVGKRMQTAIRHSRTLARCQKA